MQRHEGTEEEEGGIIAQAPDDVNHQKCTELWPATGVNHLWVGMVLGCNAVAVEAWYRETEVSRNEAAADVLLTPHLYDLRSGCRISHAAWLDRKVALKV